MASVEPIAGVVGFGGRIAGSPLDPWWGREAAQRSASSEGVPSIDPVIKRNHLVETVPAGPCGPGRRTGAAAVQPGR